MHINVCPVGSGYFYTQLCSSDYFWLSAYRVLVSEVAQSCLTVCNPMDCSLPGFSVHGIFQARVLEWVSTSFSGDLPEPGIEPRSSALQADSLPSEPPGVLGKIIIMVVKDTGTSGDGRRADGGCE